MYFYKAYTERSDGLATGIGAIQPIQDKHTLPIVSFGQSFTRFCSQCCNIFGSFSYFFILIFFFFFFLSLSCIVRFLS